VKKGTYTATVTWKIGSFGTASAKAKFNVTEYAKPRRAMQAVPMTLVKAAPAAAGD